MRAASRFCRALSLAILIILLVIYLPLSLPRLFGYDIYSVISESMEPTIKVSSIVYTKQTDPSDLVRGDIITFLPGDAITPVTHRVVENNFDDRTLITKGDANADEDFRPVWYSDVCGKVVFHMPFYGYFGEAVSSISGKAAAGVFLLASVLLGVLSAQFASFAKEKEKKNSKDREKEKAAAGGVKGSVLIMMAIFVAAGTFSAYKAASAYSSRKGETDEYDSMQQYLTQPSTVQLIDESKPEDDRPRSQVPEIDFEIPGVDFEALENDGYKNIKGWIYIPDTKVNYPVFFSGENEYYLHHTGKGEESAAGAIYLDGRNSQYFDDTHSILYGHHMADGSMFASLKSYKNEGYYPEHKYGVLITPDGNHVIEFFAGYVASVDQAAWDIEYGSKENYLKWIADEKALSCFESDVEPLSGDKVITLSTCSYEFDNARFVMHGILF